MKVATYKPAFLLHGGDLVPDGRRPRQWVHLLKTSTVISGSLPIMPCMGNHDDGPGEGERAYYNRLFHLPRADRALGGSGTEDFYAFRYGHALFAMLSTETFVGGKRGSPSRFAAQAAWLDRVLERTTALWKIVVLHRPIYTRPPPFGHPPDEAGQNRAFVPVLQRRRVDLVLAAHNHFYERFAASRCPEGRFLQPCPSADGPDGHNGTVHVTSGGGGAWVIPIAGRTDRTRPAAATKHHFVILDIADHRLTLVARDQQGKKLDEHTITKRLDGPDPCAVADAAPPPTALLRTRRPPRRSAEQQRGQKGQPLRAPPERRGGVAAAPAPWKRRPASRGLGGFSPRSW
jgi:hypothetical protein